MPVRLAKSGWKFPACFKNNLSYAMVEPLSEESVIFMVRGIRWNILVKSMRILRFLTLKKTAVWMQTVFGWRIRWQGPALNTGYMGSRGKRRSVSGVVLPCRSAKNTV